MMEIIPLGDSALIVRMRERFDDAPEQTLDTVLRAFQQLQNADIPGVIELAPAYTSVAVFFDPISIAKGAETPEKVFDWLAARIRRALASGRSPRQNQAAHDREQVEIPVCYDPEFALDIDDVARLAAISPSEVIRLHSGAEYRVACIGFVPGFPFLAGLPKELADTATGRTAKTNSTRFCRDWRRPNGNLSVAFPRRLESHRSHTIALVRSQEKSTGTFARRRACALPQNLAR